FFSVQHSLPQRFAFITQLQREKGPALSHPLQEDAVPLPGGQGGGRILVYPHKLALVALPERAGKARGVEEIHVFPLPAVREESDYAAQAKVRQRQARFLPHLPQQALLRRFILLEFSAHADPLV